MKRNYDIYTVMLYIAFIALAAACLLLYLELRAYGTYPWWSPATSAAASSATQAIDSAWASVAPSTRWLA